MLMALDSRGAVYGSRRAAEGSRDAVECCGKQYGALEKL